MNDFDGPIPFDEAIAISQRKQLLPTNLTSAQLSQLRAQLKQRAVFSARLDKAGVLQVLQKNLEQIVSQVGLDDEGGRLRSIPEAKAQLKEAMFQAGVPLASADRAGGIRDFYSDARRQLMVETNVLDTLGFGRHVATQNPEMLWVNPALELVRMIEPKGGDAAKRPWEERWQAAMADIGSDADSGCTDPDEADGRMVALKNHPIWQALGEGAGGYTDGLGNSWAPFAFNSGMNTIDVDRDDAVDLGIITDTQQIEPDDSFDLNENLEASVAKFSGELQSQLIGGGLQIVDGVLRLIGGLGTNAARDLLIRAAINDQVILRDSLGRFAHEEGTLSARDNIRRGRRAIERALRTKRDVRDAMQVKGLGTVHFLWGRPGTSQMNEDGATHADGYGIAHIQAKRGDGAARMLPVVLARGRLVPHPEDSAKRAVKFAGWTAIVKKQNADQSFVVTHIDSDVKLAKNTGRLPLRSIGPGQRGEPDRHPCPTHLALLFGKGPVVALNVATIAQSRAQLKAFQRQFQEAQ